MSRGFLRPSFEETLASNRSRSVGEEEEGGVVFVGTCPDTVSFVFHLFFLLIFLSVIARSLLFYVGTPVPLSPMVSFVSVGPRCIGRSKTGVGVSLG